MFNHSLKTILGIVLILLSTGCADHQMTDAPAPTEPPATDSPSPEPTTALADTPVPTLTPVPTSTPLPTLSPEMIAYRDKVLPLAEEIIASSREIDLLLADVTPAHYGDLDWLDSIGPHLMTVGNDYFALAAVTPPDEAADLHAAILDASQVCDEATDLLAEGILHLEDDRVASGAEMIKTCIAQLDDAAVSLDDYLARFE